MAKLRQRAKAGKPIDRALRELDARLASSQALLEKRRAQPVMLNYPESLPVAEKRENILAALRAHQIVVVAGETGSGKTTQLPKLCLELGLGRRGLIGHTQPRRLAARFDRLEVKPWLKEEACFEDTWAMLTCDRLLETWLEIFEAI